MPLANFGNLFVVLIKQVINPFILAHTQLLHIFNFVFLDFGMDVVKEEIPNLKVDALAGP